MKKEGLGSAQENWTSAGEIESRSGNNKNRKWNDHNQRGPNILKLIIAMGICCHHQKVVQSV